MEETTPLRFAEHPSVHRTPWSVTEPILRIRFDDENSDDDDLQGGDHDHDLDPSEEETPPENQGDHDHTLPIT